MGQYKLQVSKLDKITRHSVTNAHVICSEHTALSVLHTADQDANTIRLHRTNYRYGTNLVHWHEKLMELK